MARPRRGGPYLVFQLEITAKHRDCSPFPSETGLVTQSLLTLTARGWNGQTFMFEGWPRGQGGTSTSRVPLSGGALAADLTRENIGTGWTPVRHAFSIPPGVTTLAVGIGRSAGSGIDWDDVMVRPV